MRRGEGGARFVQFPSRCFGGLRARPGRATGSVVSRRDPRRAAHNNGLPTSFCAGDVMRGHGPRETMRRRAMLLEVNPDTVRFIIDRLRQFQAKEGVTFPDDADDDWARQILADYADDPVVAEVRSTIDDLDPDQQVELVALTWVGRGVFGPDEWEAALAQARDSWNERTADYLLGTPLAADFLEEGLEQIESADEGGDDEG